MPRRSLIAPVVAAAVLGGLAAACATPMSYGEPYGAGPAVFQAEDFAWSQRGGRGAIDGSITYSERGVRYRCTGEVVLTPETRYTRDRFRSLYGSAESAAIPEAVVRARSVAPPPPEYRGFVRSQDCTSGRFAFTGLPDGVWYLVAPVTAGGDQRVVLMKRVATRGGSVRVGL